MKALVKYDLGPGNLEIRDLPIPVPGAGEVQIEVKFAGICGSDLHIYHSDIAIPIRPPVVIGHEFSGVVSAVGEGVADLKPGDRVVSETAYTFCGRCSQCITGFYNLCPERRTLGYWHNGVFASHTVVPAARIHRLPESIDDLSGAMIEPLACVVHAIHDMSTIRAGDVVLVSGPGAIGLMAAQVAKAQGAVVVLSGTAADAARLELAHTLGIDYTINIQEDSLPDLISRLTGSEGADCVIECSGNAAATNTGLLLCKKRGCFVQIGLGGKPVTFDLDTVCYRELRFSGSLGSTKSSWNKAIDLVAGGRVNLAALASHTLPITRWREAFDLFENKQGCKLILMPVVD
jgi:L-iditol 2-dehydrogenase